MKLNIYILMLLLSAWSLQSCDNGDDESISVPKELQQAFSSKYPNVSNVKWEMKGTYYIADFHNGYEASAWFSPDGRWYMTETDIPYAKLPDAIKASFEASEYKDWKKDDVDMLEREGLETVYVIEIEKQNKEAELYYSADGILIKCLTDTENDQDEHYPIDQLPVALKSFINEKYAGARIVEVDKEGIAHVEVTVIHEGISKEILFDGKNSWVCTSWETFIIPVAVGKTISEQFPGYHIDDSEYVETPAKEYYLIELEGNNLPDKIVKIDSSGQLLV